MDAVFLNTTRSGYAPDQCGRTLTVGELIELLEEFDYDRPVYFRNDNGYTYGSLTDRTVFGEEYEEKYEEE